MAIDNYTLETYILKEIENLKKYLSDLDMQKDAPLMNKRGWSILHAVTHAKINLLYKCLTAHDNKYSEMQEKNKSGL